MLSHGPAVDVREGVEEVRRDVSFHVRDSWPNLTDVSSLDSLDPLLLAKLPPDVIGHLERALATPSDKPGFRSKHVIEACRAASFPSARVYPLASELSEAHRALAQLLAQARSTTTASVARCRRRRLRGGGGWD